jgi:AraC family transcriptional regulator
MNSQPLIHPSATLKPEWVLNRRSLQTESLTIEHHLESADEIESPPFSHHILTVLLSEIAPRQVTQFDEREYDGVQHRGDLWFLPAGLPAFFHWESTDEALIFMLEPNLLRNVAIETDCLNPAQVEVLPVVYRTDLQLGAIAHLFLQEITTEGIGSQLYQDSLVNLLALHLLRHYCAFEPKLKANRSGLSQTQLKQALEYIQAHLSEEISLSAIATEIGISRYHFSAQFKRSMGIPPYEYVLQQRVNRAKQLLLCSEFSIAEIALEVGFADQTHFTKQFRKATGSTPARFKD